MAFEVPPLTYAYDALEPYIDTETMHLHQAVFPLPSVPDPKQQETIRLPLDRAD